MNTLNKAIITSLSILTVACGGGGGSESAPQQTVTTPVVTPIVTPVVTPTPTPSVITTISGIALDAEVIGAEVVIKDKESGEIKDECEAGTTNDQGEYTIECDGDFDLTTLEVVVLAGGIDDLTGEVIDFEMTASAEKEFVTPVTTLGGDSENPYEAYAQGEHLPLVKQIAAVAALKFEEIDESKALAVIDFALEAPTALDAYTSALNSTATNEFTARIVVGLVLKVSEELLTAEESGTDKVQAAREALAFVQEATVETIDGTYASVEYFAAISTDEGEVTEEEHIAIQEENDKPLGKLEILGSSAILECNGIVFEGFYDGKEGQTVFYTFGQATNADNYISNPEIAENVQFIFTSEDLEKFLASCNG